MFDFRGEPSVSVETMSAGDDMVASFGKSLATRGYCAEFCGSKTGPIWQKCSCFFKALGKFVSFMIWIEPETLDTIPRHGQACGPLTVRELRQSDLGSSANDESCEE